MRIQPGLVLCLALAGLAARAEEPGWEQKKFDCLREKKACKGNDCCEVSFGVWVREKPGSDVREVRAVGEIDSPPEKIYEVITDFEHYAEFMPYVEDSKVIRRTDDKVITWAVMNAPMVSRRDWVVEVKLDPQGMAGTTWTLSSEGPAPTDHAVRLKVNNGSWKLEALDGGRRTRATYYLYTDPGGSIPTFIANKANTMALPDLFTAIRKRAAK